MQERTPSNTSGLSVWGKHRGYCVCMCPRALDKVGSRQQLAGTSIQRTATAARHCVHWSEAPSWKYYYQSGSCRKTRVSCAARPLEMLPPRDNTPGVGGKASPGSMVGATG